MIFSSLSSRLNSRDSQLTKAPRNNLTRSFRQETVLTMELRPLLFTLTKHEARPLCEFIVCQSSPLYLLTFIRRSFVLPEVQATMARIETQFAVQQAARLGSSGSVSASLLTNAPLAVVNPLGYVLDNVRPFDSAM